MCKGTTIASVAVLFLLAASEGASSEVAMQLGGVYKFECRSQYPVTWYTSDLLHVIQVCNSTQNCAYVHQILSVDKTSSDLMFPMVQADNEGVFICTDSVKNRVKQITTKVLASENIEYGKSYTFECHSDLLRVIWYFRDVDNKQYLVKECKSEENCPYSYFQIERPNGSVELILSSAMLISHERMFDCKDSNGTTLKKINPMVVPKYEHSTLPFGETLSYRCPVTNTVDKELQYSWQYFNHTNGSYEAVGRNPYTAGVSQCQQYDCDGIHSTVEFIATSSVVFRCIMFDELDVLNKPVWIINVTLSEIDNTSKAEGNGPVENNTSVIIPWSLVCMEFVVIIVLAVILLVKYNYKTSNNNNGYELAGKVSGQ